MTSDTDDKAEWVRNRAYHIWREEGETHGQHDDHWQRAEREYDERGQADSEQPVQPGPDLQEDLIEPAEPGLAERPTSVERAQAAERDTADEALDHV